MGQAPLGLSGQLSGRSHAESRVQASANVAVQAFADSH